MQTSAVALEASAFYWREFNIIHCKKVNQTGRKCENPKVQRINLKLINSSKIRWKGCKSKVTLNFSFEVHQQDNLTNPRGYFEHIILCGNVRLLHITAAALAYLIYTTLSVLVLVSTICRSWVTLLTGGLKECVCQWLPSLEFAVRNMHKCPQTRELETKIFV